jgi:CheY-like chemotaxis protein
MSDDNLRIQSGEVLIVDDASENLKTLSAILTPLKYKVRLAQSGMQALKSVQMKAPDVILLDIRMPEMNGYEVCRRLKQDRNSREIPVIFISALRDYER